MAVKAAAPVPAALMAPQPGPGPHWVEAELVADLLKALAAILGERAKRRKGGRRGSDGGTHGIESERNKGSLSGWAAGWLSPFKRLVREVCGRFWPMANRLLSPVLAALEETGVKGEV